MEIISTGFEDLALIKHNVFGDDRGFFMESYNSRQFNELGIDTVFVQDNLSKSSANVVRGLHLQAPPFEQGKLVRVITGSVLDVVVDVRKKSPTYGQHFKVELTEENKLSLWIPPGFLHGFATLRDNTIFSYKCTSYYSKVSEQTVLWNDKNLNINWQVENPILSEKDKLGQDFNLFLSPF